MKKIITFILAIALAISLAACDTTYAEAAAAAEERAANARFIIVEESVSGLGNCADIIVDTQTGVMYLYIDVPSSHKLGMTALLNTDGTPMIWEGWEK